MKKVRFEMIPANYGSNEMQDMDCHYPRPFMAQGDDPAASSSQDLYSKILKMKSDPLKLYENSNSSPYSLSQKTVLHHASVPEARIEPSNELELSMLDASSQEPRQPAFSRNVFPTSFHNTYSSVNPPEACQLPYSPVLTSSKDRAIPNKAKDDSFFIKHNNINIGQVPSVNYIPKQFTKLSMDKENNPIMKKAEIIQKAVTKSSSLNSCRDSSAAQSPFQIIEQHSCKCHHCNVETVKKTMTPHNFHQNKQILQVLNPVVENSPDQCPYALKYCMNCVCEAHSMKKLCQHSNNQPPHIMTCQSAANNIVVPQNALEKKISMIQNFEQSKKGECTDIERSTAISKETQEPTVADLFKIIKLQSEQLQLLQEKVDKFISVSNKPQPTFPVQNYVSEQIALETVNNDHHKISIGVMTSFEMVTSTIINKEVVKQTISNQNAQVQCNRSQISIKEVAFREPVQNFLDGIQKKNTNTSDSSLFTSLHETDNVKCNNIQPDNMVEEKTFNDMSLCNVQVDNATTPLISPDQSMYLDVRDYSESDSGSNDQSNVGWTYYNKVMTHVNGMLQDSDMPSSASALYRNTRQHCLQMQIDKTNISVTKRVKFGDDPLGLHQPHLYPPSDTSMKMNQLAAKYLNATSEKQLTCSPRNNLANNEMSFATRNYMERHQLLQGSKQCASRTPAPEMPRFLDITALKRQQQHKLL